MKDLIWFDSIQPNRIRNQGYNVAAYNLKSIIEGYGIDIEYPNHKNDSMDEYDKFKIGYEIDFSEYDLSQYKILVNNLLPTAYKKSPNYSIGFSYWETNMVPKDWIKDMSNMDELWTTSLFVKNVFEDTKINVPVYNFKLGIDEKIYKKINPVIKNKFIFIHDGSPSLRKNTQTVVDAFLKLFRGNDDYHLIIKSIGSPTARYIYNQEYMGSLYDKKQITVIDQTITDQEIVELYASANCMVYPTSGEGWGMIPFQSIAMGIPTICTNFSACEEFAELSIPLDYKLSDENMVGIYSGAGQWAIPNFDDLCDKMLYVANNYEEAKEKTSRGSDIIHSSYKWSDVAKEYYDRICQILKK